jgi:hypothetical protein
VNEQRELVGDGDAVMVGEGMLQMEGLRTRDDDNGMGKIPIASQSLATP